MKRGRRSSADLSIVVDASRRLPPAVPMELTDAQAAVWRDVVGSLPGDWVSKASAPILIAYCRHTCRARLLEMQIARFEMEWARVEGGLERLDRMLAMAERESRMAIACARALRITPQSQVLPRTAGRTISNTLPAGAVRPWD